jgi:NAD(P)H-flavin reductase
VLRAVLENPSDDTRFSLIYAARVPEDLLLRKELDAWAEQHEQFTVRILGARLCFGSAYAPFDKTHSLNALTLFFSSQVHYTVDVPPPDWPYSVGFLTAEMLAAHFPEATKDVGALICGPPPMVNFAVKPNLEKLGYVEDQFFIF